MSVNVVLLDVAIWMPDRSTWYSAPAGPSQAIVAVLAVIAARRRFAGVPTGWLVGGCELLAGVGVAVVPGGEARVAVTTGVVTPPDRTE